MCGFENFSRWFTNERESLRGRPKMIYAGDRLQSGSGVLRSCNMARKKRSVEAACRAGIGHQGALGSFNCDFCSAVWLREAGGGHAMSYAPEA